MACLPFETILGFFADVVTQTITPTEALFIGASTIGPVLAAVLIILLLSMIDQPIIQMVLWMGLIWSSTNFLALLASLFLPFLTPSSGLCRILLSNTAGTYAVMVLLLIMMLNWMTRR